jgi:thimet oligopeptidase
VFKTYVTVFSVAVVILIGTVFYTWSSAPIMFSKNLHSFDQVKALFPTTPAQIEQETAYYLAQAQEQLDAILAIPDEKRTFANTAQAIDELESLSNLAIKYNTIELVVYVYPDDTMRKVALESSQKIREFLIDMGANKKLYQAFKAYAEGNALKEDLSPEQRYFIDESMKSFKRAGLHLPDQELQAITALKKELAQLTQRFDKNIDEDKSTIIVSRDGLKGLDEEFIASLKRSNDDYIVGVDYPTYFRVMEHCAVEDTRHRLYEAFMNRAYPANKLILQKIITLRDQVAKKLGYASYAHLDIDSQMAQTPDRAHSFLQDLVGRARNKEKEEMALLMQELPESVTLTKEGKIKAWDLAFVTSQYKKKHFDLDERAISEYFPMQHTIDQLLDIYRVFLGVDFQEIAAQGLWHNEVKVIQVFNQDRTQSLGYLFLDLHPRPNKYSHAAHANIVPGVQLGDGSRIPTTSLLMCNFPKGMQDRPALLMRSDVKTFFHEFGHALHALLGATQMASFSGTNVKRDFVELPSQMLEEWLSDKDILKKVSCHYKTGVPLPDETIDKIIALKQFGTGSFVTRQCVLSNISLCCFKEGESKDPDEIESRCYAEIQPHIEHGPNRHLTASFGHLTGYSAKYYGYLWSKVFALDMFDMIKQHGLLNPEIGKRYVTHVIGRGGSCDPNELLANFLGREATSDAFMKHMGF